MKKLYSFLFLIFSFSIVCKSAIIFSEDIGNPSGTTLITAYTGWQNNGVLTFTGTGDVRTTTPSTGYSGSTGLGNVYLANNATNKTLIISGFSTSSYTAIALNFGVYKSTTASNGAELVVEYSTGGVSGPWTAITIPVLPTGTGTAIWAYRTSTSTIPAGTNAIRITNNNAAAVQFRLDDISLTGTYTGATPELQLQQPAGSDSACGMIYTFPNTNVGNTNDVTIRIENTGTAIMNITSYPITGADATEFSFVTPPPSTIAASSYSDVVVRFSPGYAGTKTALITLNTNDADESTCEINLKGTASYAPCTELIISEYGEPVVGNGKYIELYNGTSSSINLSDYQLWKINNGGTWPENTLSLSGTLLSGNTYVVANNATDVPGANLYDATFCNWNGNDAVGLAKFVGASYYLIDAVGTDGADPGTGWSVAGVSNATEGHTLVRKTSVNFPDSSWSVTAGTTLANSQWYVRPYQLTNVGCNVNSCLISSTIGFDIASATVAESNSTVTVNVTMPTAPSSTVNAIISDALLGTATSSTDYATFSPTTLTFTPAETYPNTKTVTLTIYDDAVSESNENIVLSIDAQCGALVNNDTYTLTIIDNEIPEGLVINEFSQGVNAGEYVELVVTGTPGTTVDLRGWIIDDNSGIFSGGYGTQMGIADGHVKFSDICTWEKVPVGSIILIYHNCLTKNASITLADDPTDANLDYTYVIGIDSFLICSNATPNLYFSSDCTLPNNTSYDQYTPPVYGNAFWNAMQFRNAGDAVQVRSPSGGFFHGLSYGTKAASSDCGTCALNQSNHPDYAVYGTDALYFSGTNNNTYTFLNINDNDYRKLSNWTKTTANTPNALETPGTFNGTNNQTWILSLRKPFGVVLDDQNYTCNLRAYESRYYLDGIDSIIYWIKNNGATDHGAFTAQTIIHNTAVTGKGFQNTDLTGTPLFMQKTYAATPTVASPANYKIKFFVSTQELQDYCDYINPILDAIPGFFAGHHYTPATVIPHLKIYRSSNTDRAWTVTTDAQVQIVTPVVGTYGAYTTFEYDGFTGFSGYALGDIVTPIIGLPVELTAFNANCNNDVVTINWTTASEKDFDYFELQRSPDAVQFSTIATIPTTGNSTQEKHYSFVDEYPFDNTYYRLKQIDKYNTSPVYSQIVLTKCTEDEIIHNLQVYFSNNHTISITLNANNTSSIQINLYEISGKLLYTNNNQITSDDFIFSIDLQQQLAKGIYIIQIVAGNTTKYKKISIQ